MIEPRDIGRAVAVVAFMAGVIGLVSFGVLTDQNEPQHLYLALVELAIAHDAESIVDLPGCWEIDIDERWHLAFNGGDAARRSAGGDNVPPYSCFVTYNGWPAAVVDPAGWTVAAGACANQSDLRRAIANAMPREGATHHEPAEIRSRGDRRHRRRPHPHRARAGAPAL